MNLVKPVSLIALAVLALTADTVQAQEKALKKDSSAEKKSHWVLGVAYLSNDVYLGRRDSVAIPYITPSIGYHDKSGFFFTGSLSYLPTSGDSRIDKSTIEAGYGHSSDKFNLELSVAKDFYSDQSYAVTSEIKGRASAYLSYDFGFIEPSLDLGAEFSDNTDIGVGFGLGHSFTIIEDQLELDPAVHVNGATQNFYGSYFSKRRYAAKRSGGSSTKSIAASLANAAQFQIMDYELEAPLDYTIQKKLKLNFTPTFAIPVNPTAVSVTTTSGTNKSTQSSTENLSSVFYFSVGVSYSF